MRTLAKAAVVTMLLLFVAGLACANEVTEGTVVSVANWLLTIKPQSGENVAFSPRWVQERGKWMPARPARTMLPALEAGETVRITWTMDTRENRRRIDSIEITSPIARSSRGTIVTRSANELVIRPLEKPGTVTLDTKWVQIEGKWVPDPQISRALQSLKPGDKATINWAWDQEGRKRILEISNVEPAPVERDRK